MEESGIAGCTAAPNEQAGTEPNDVVSITDAGILYFLASNLNEGSLITSVTPETVNMGYSLAFGSELVVVDYPGKSASAAKDVPEDVPFYTLVGCALPDAPCDYQLVIGLKHAKLVFECEGTCPGDLVTRMVTGVIDTKDYAQLRARVFKHYKDGCPISAPSKLKAVFEKKINTRPDSLERPLHDIIIHGAPDCCMNGIGPVVLSEVLSTYNISPCTPLSNIYAQDGESLNKYITRSLVREEKELYKLLLYQGEFNGYSSIYRQTGASIHIGGDAVWFRDGAVLGEGCHHEITSQTEGPHPLYLLAESSWHEAQREDPEENVTLVLENTVDESSSDEHQEGNDPGLVLEPTETSEESSVMYVSVNGGSSSGPTFEEEPAAQSDGF